ncbi:hypothetical protein OROHE_001563 [Orobanche hederae]
MDSDLWATRLAAAKRQLNMQNTHQIEISHSHTSSQFDKFNMMEDFEGDGEVRPEYPCPYCYEEFEIASSLCSHLETDHSFESKSTGYMQHHSQSRRLPFPSNQALSSLPRRNLRETYSHVLQGGNVEYRSNTAALLLSSSSSSTSTSENFLSSLVLSFSTSEIEDVSKSLMSTLEGSSAKNIATQQYWKSRFSLFEL